MTSIDADIHPQSTIREFSPLTEVHLDQLGASVTTAKPIRKAAGYARLSGWMTLLAGAMSVLISIGSIPGMLLGLGLAAIGMRELGLARKLDGLDLKAPASLAINQLMLGAVLIGYAIFKFATYDSNDSVLAGSLASDPTISSSPQFAGTIDQLSQIEHMLHLGVYALLILIAFVMQGATAVYYIAKRSRIKQLHHHSPDWVLSVHRVMSDPKSSNTSRAA